MPRRNCYISIAGVLGVGKTTVAELLAQKLGFHILKERVDENIFLPLFYEKPKEWALHSQLFYLKEKALQLQDIRELLREKNVVQDVPIYQDCFTYAKAQCVLGNMTIDEYALYWGLFDTLIKNLPVPDLIIELEAPLEVLKERIQKRGRVYEKGIDPSYLKLLSDLQYDWISKSALPIVTVDAHTLNLVDDPAHQKQFTELIRSHLTDIKAAF